MNMADRLYHDNLKNNIVYNLNYNKIIKYAYWNTYILKLEFYKNMQLMLLVFRIYCNLRRNLVIFVKILYLKN